MRGVSGSPGAGEFFIEFANVSSSKDPKNGRADLSVNMYFITCVWLDLTCLDFQQPTLSLSFFGVPARSFSQKCFTAVAQ